MKFIKTCESIFNEIQQLRRDLLSGKITSEVYALQMGGISQLEKQQKHMLTGTIAEHRLKKAIPVDLNRGTVEIEEERFECVDRNMVITCATGFPTTVAPGGTSFVTTAPAPTTAPFPISTPEVITAFAPIHTSSWIFTLRITWFKSMIGVSVCLN